MSLLPILWALKSAPVADATERLILIAQAEHAFSDGSDAFPSKKTLAEIALSDPKTVQRKLRGLEKRGLIARGNQAAAAYISEWFRPTVYDLLIPYSWFPDIDQINEERKARGKPPLTPENRPDIAPAPPRKRRSDVGKPRKKPAGKSGTPDGGGDCESPGRGGEDVQEGGTESPGGGDCESRRGGLEDPQPSPSNPPLSTLPGDAPSARSAGDARRATTGSRGQGSGSGSAATGAASAPTKSPSHQSKQKLAPADAAAIRVVESGIPDTLRDLLPYGHLPHSVRTAVLAQFRAGPNGCAQAAPQDIADRIARRWAAWGYLDAALYGTGLDNPVAVAHALVRPPECPDPSCLDGVLDGSGEECRACRERRAARRAARRAGKPTRKVPAAGSGGGRRVLTECLDCHKPFPGPVPPDGVCAGCREEAAAAVRAMAERWEREEADLAQAAAKAAQEAQEAQEAAERAAQERQDIEAQREAEADARHRAEDEELARIRAELAAQHPELAAVSPSAQGAPF